MVDTNEFEQIWTILLQKIAPFFKLISETYQEKLHAIGLLSIQIDKYKKGLITFIVQLAPF